MILNYTQIISKSEQLRIAPVTSPLPSVHVSEHGIDNRINYITGVIISGRRRRRRRDRQTSPA